MVSPNFDDDLLDDIMEDEIEPNRDGNDLEDSDYGNYDSSFGRNGGGLFASEYQDNFGDVDTSGMKKKFLLVILAGLILITLAFWLYPKIVTKRAQSKTDLPTNQLQDNQPVIQDESVAVPNNQVNTQEQPVVQEQQVVTQQNSKQLQQVQQQHIEAMGLNDLSQNSALKKSAGAYREIKPIQNLYLVGENQAGIFTLKDIRFYIKTKEDDEQAIQYQCILSGNISGLIGTFDIELPIQYSANVQKGMQLKVSYDLYKYQGQNEKSVVSDLQIMMD